MSSYERKDRYYQKAKKEGYPARSAYKLIEMNRQFKIFKPGMKIVDLGCAPGGWLKVIEEKIANNRQRATITGIDLLPLKYRPSAGTVFIQGNFMNAENQDQMAKLLEGGADWVVSDMSPDISGIRFRDMDQSLQLCRAALGFAKRVLKKGGGLVVKIFPGPEMGRFREELSSSFKKTATFIPEATRDTSSEIYLVSTGFLPS